jgi:hypothetical protein
MSYLPYQYHDEVGTHPRSEQDGPYDGGKRPNFDLGLPSPPRMAYIVVQK